MNIFLKRLIDIGVSFILVILFMPLILLTALLIWIVDGLPVFFKQSRPGINEKIFNIYKFRTMRSSGTNTSEPDHTRITKLGNFLRKTSIDELPQLYNVLIGDLSLVGPRPLLTEYLPLYNDRQKKRHRVKPGITGWAQINGRNAINWEQKFELDIWYVENWSLYLDLKILLITICKVLTPKDVNASEKLTMDKFKGTKNGTEI